VYTGLVAVVYVLLQSAALVALGIEQAIRAPGTDVDAWLAGSADNGLVLAVATITSMVGCVALMRLLARRRPPSPWRFLGLEPVAWKAVAQGCVVMIAFVIGTDLLTLALDKPVVPPFMREAYASSGSVLLLAFALMVGAPLLEELFFRGFLVSGFRMHGMSPVLIATITSMLWAVIHTQYEPYFLVLIFVMGLLLTAARFRFGSIWPCIAMHSLANAWSLAETIALHA